MRLGSHPAFLWITRHIISPFDRSVVRFSKGRFPPVTSFFVPTLLLKVVGRRSGSEHTIPLIYVNEGECYIVGNARPKGERRNPWVLNLRAAGRGRVVVRRKEFEVRARELEGEELERWFQALTEVWPALSDHHAATGERSVFILEPTDQEDSTNE
ncbi:MAG: nitroreductase/quinone reductase family protein [Acidimicrobiia bacterium]